MRRSLASREISDMFSYRGHEGLWPVYRWSTRPLTQVLYRPNSVA